MIVSDSRNPKARGIYAELMQRLPEEFLPENLIVVIGGDGFMLRTVKEYGVNHIYLGLNAGHLGFLLNDIDSWDEVVAKLKNGAWSARAFPLLEARFLCRNGETIVERAINDIYMERSSGQTAALSLTIGKHQVVKPIVCDGIIFSTALGSTAYAFSAGGMSCHPTLRTLSVTTICPHHPRLPPFTLPVTARARVEVLDPEHRPVRGVADGRSVEDIVAVDVAVAAEQVRLAYLDGHDFTAQLVSKIVHPWRGDRRLMSALSECCQPEPDQ
ncbi:MAG: hypothetical protein HN348_01880 [Proteobacteria bacterium]|jgi:NAD+ kinase|nr:hypothetical protein [Pseudomonadota bacterium]